MLERRSGAWFKKALFVAAAKRQFNSFYTKKACSALLRGFESRNRDWEPKNRIFVYNAFALYNCPSVVDEQQLKDLHINIYNPE